MTPQNDLLNSLYVSRLHTSLATLLRHMGRKDQAVPLEAVRLELWRSWDRKLPNNPFVGRQLETARLSQMEKPLLNLPPGSAK